MDILEEKNKLCKIGKLLFDRELAFGASGNISVLLDNNEILASPSGYSLGSLNQEIVSHTSQDGQLLAGLKPTKELIFHRALYEVNPNIKAIVHLHSQYATAYACLKNINADNVIKPMTPYLIMRMKHITVISYHKPGDPGLAKEIAEKGTNSNAFLLLNHGMVVGGRDLEDAFNNAEEFERSCWLYFITNKHEVNFLTQEQISEL